MIKIMHPCFFVLSRVDSVESNHLQAFWRAGSDCPSSALCGSSTTMMSAPRPVNAPSTDVAIRKPPAVVSKFEADVFPGLNRVSGNIRWYQSELIIWRHCRPEKSDKAWP